MVETYSVFGRTRVLYALIFGYSISFYKSKGSICLTSNIVNMFIKA